jgi:hypothetical protein
MTQANADPQPAAAKPAARPSAGSQRANIYTVLVAVTAAALLVGVIFLVSANMKMTGQSNPFFIEAKK